MKKQQKIILVTGAGAGIGFALTRILLEQGHIVYAGVRDLKRARTDYKKEPRKPLFVLLDVNKKSHCTQAINTILKKHKRIDALVNNAGFGMYGAFEELTDAEYRSQIETNLFGTVALCRQALPHMRKEKAGGIYNISSVLGFQSIPTGSAYTASKFAVEGFSESLRFEVAPFGISVVLIEPGSIRTNFLKNMKLTKDSQNPSSDYAFLNKLIDRKYTGINTSADNAAQKIAHIIKKNRPATRYRIGLDSHLVWLFQKTTPLALRNYLTILYLKIKFNKQNK